MPKKIPEPTNIKRERTFMVGVEIRNEKNLLSLDESFEELALLADTAGLAIVGQLSQKLDKPYVQTLIGPGKIEELKSLISEIGVDVVLFDNELSPRHLRELEETFGTEIKVLDRTALINMNIACRG
jgi:GTP-binding protein HflX